MSKSLGGHGFTYFFSSVRWRSCFFFPPKLIPAASFWRMIKVAWEETQAGRYPSLSPECQDKHLCPPCSRRRRETPPPPPPPPPSPPLPSPPVLSGHQPEQRKGIQTAKKRRISFDSNWLKEKRRRRGRIKKPRVNTQCGNFSHVKKRHLLLLLLLFLLQRSAPTPSPENASPQTTWEKKEERTICQLNIGKKKKKLLFFFWGEGGGWIVSAIAHSYNRRDHTRRNGDPKWPYSLSSSRENLPSSAPPPLLNGIPFFLRLLPPCPPGFISKREKEMALPPSLLLLLFMRSPSIPPLSLPLSFFFSDPRREFGLATLLPTE